MKQRILVCLTLAALVVMGLLGVAFAAEDPIKLDMMLSATRFSGPAEVTVTISVTNASDKDMPGPLALYNPDGHIIEEFGTPTLTAGASKTWTGTWMVTEKQLQDGKITFAIRYPVVDASGASVNKTLPFFHAIVLAEQEPEVEINRYITPSMAGKGQEVSVIYEILNVGTVDITDVVIKESSTVSQTSGTIASVPAGEKATYTFTVKMGSKNLTSNAAITYRAGGNTYSASKPDAVIRYGNVKLTATLTADKKGGNPGDTVTLTLTLKNSGKADYENVTVTDAFLGTVFTGLTVEAGKTVTHTKEITISQTADLMFTVSGSDASGNTVETSTGRITVTAVDPAKEVALAVNAVANRETIYMLPGIVTFTVSVTNTGSVEATDVTVFSNGVDLYTFESLQPGQTRSFVRDVRVETPGKFRFDARVSDQLGQSRTTEGNIVQIVHAQPTAAPTQVPLATPAMPQLENVPETDGLPAVVGTVQSALRILGWVMGVVAVAAAALIITGIVSRAKNAAESSLASDHLELDGFRDYTEAVPAKQRRMMPDNDPDDLPDFAPRRRVEPEEAPAEPEEDSSVVEDAMTQLYPEAKAEASAEADELPPPMELPEPMEAPAPIDEVPAPAAGEVPAEEEVTFRRRHRATTEE